MTEGAAEHRRIRLDVYLHLAGEDRAFLAGLLLEVESRRGVATPTRGRGLSTFIKAFCVAALVAVVAGASYRAAPWEMPHGSSQQKPDLRVTCYRTLRFRQVQGKSRLPLQGA